MNFYKVNEFEWVNLDNVTTIDITGTDVTFRFEFGNARQFDIESTDVYNPSNYVSKEAVERLQEILLHSEFKARNKS